MHTNLQKSILINLIQFFFHVSKSEKQFGVLFVIIGKMAYAFGLVCIYCEQIRYGFEKISDKIYKLDWYRYPLEVQRLLPVIVHHVQQPVDLVAFGNIPCTRETFKMVSRNV